MQTRIGDDILMKNKNNTVSHNLQIKDVKREPEIKIVPFSSSKQWSGLHQIKHKHIEDCQQRNGAIRKLFFFQVAIFKTQPPQLNEL